MLRTPRRQLSKRDVCLQGARNEVLAAGLDKLQAAQVGALPDAWVQCLGAIRGPSLELRAA